MTRKKSSLEIAVRENIDEDEEISPIFNAGVNMLCAQLKEGKPVLIGPYDIRIYGGSPQQAFHNAVDFIQRRARRNGYNLELDIVGCNSKISRDEDMGLNTASLYFTIQTKQPKQPYQNLSLF